MNTTGFREFDVIHGWWHNSWIVILFTGSVCSIDLISALLSLESQYGSSYLPLWNNSLFTCAIIYKWWLKNLQVSFCINFLNCCHQKAKSHIIKHKEELPCSKCLLLNLHKKFCTLSFKLQWNLYVKSTLETYIPKYFFPIMSSGAA